MSLEKEEMLLIVGGAISGTLINSIVRIINAALDVGRSLGTAIRRVISRKICKV